MLVVVLSARAIGEDGTSLANSKDILNIMPIELAPKFDFKIPSRPAGHVLDNAHFLTPEILQRLDDTLSQEAREHRVDVYLLTVPSLQKGALDPFTKQVGEAWTKGLFGATIVFDDETGHVAIEASDKLVSRFYEFELSALLRDSMSSKKRPRLSREGLEHTTNSVRTAVHELKMRANKEDHNSFLTQVGLAIVGIVAALVGTFEYFRRRPAGRVTSVATTSETPSPES